MEFLIVLAILLIVAFVVSGPLRKEWTGRSAQESGDVSDRTGELERELLELEAARDAKYREIRDADLDHRTGKLSDEDFSGLDATLRAEAVEILRDLDRTLERLGATIKSP